jgi:thiamine biosynthesis lipoprotein
MRYTGILFLLLLVGCGSRSSYPLAYETLSGYAQGSTYTITYAGQGLDQTRIDSILHEIDLSLSQWIDSSVISRWNASDTGIQVDAHFAAVWQDALRIYELTKGTFNPSLLPVITYWGFGGRDMAAPERPDSLAVDSLLRLCKMPDSADYRNGVLRKRHRWQKLDFNGIAQGYTVDVLCSFLESLGITNYMVEVGGELRTAGNGTTGDKWNIGIDKPVSPDEPRELMAILKVQGGMATSGSYRKFYELEGQKYSHTIDPATGFPVKHTLLSATVWASSCMEADALATACMVMGPGASIAFDRADPELTMFLIFAEPGGQFSTYLSPELSERIVMMSETD